VRPWWRAPRVGHMAKTNASAAAQIVAAKCLGKSWCSVAPSRALFGVPKGFDAAANRRGGLALSVKVQCSALSDAEMARRQVEEDAMDSQCSDGCLTCVSESRSVSPDETIIIACDSDAIISGIEDAVYGAEDEQPPWMFDETVGMCLQPASVIPSSDMCRWDSDRVMVQLRRACAGRPKCKLTWADVDRMFPVDACTGKAKRLSIIARCQRTQLPRDASAEVRPNSFGMLHYEERLLLGDASGALVDSYQARTAFETSPTVLASEAPKSLSEFVYSSAERRKGVSVGGSAAVIRRFLATFTLRSDEGMPGINIWHFRVMGDPSFWRLGGVMALIPQTTHADECDAIGGCQMAGCTRKVHDDHGAVTGCVFSLNLKPGVMYQLHMYGVSDRAVPDAGLSIEFKPPSHCLLHVNCDNPAAVQGLCRILSQRDMPFQRMKVGELPHITCAAPSLAEVVRCKLIVSKPVLKLERTYGSSA